MRQLFLLLSLSLIFFPACNDDEDQTTPRTLSETYDTDEGIDAPIVACSDAFEQFEYTSISVPFFTQNRRIVGYSFNGADVGLAIDGAKNLWRVTNNGESWEQLPYNLGNGFHSLPFFVSEETVYLIRSRDQGTINSILRSDDKGNNFQELAFFDVRSVTGLHFDDPVNGLALVTALTPEETTELQLLATADGGASWTRQTLPTDTGSGKFTTVEGRLAISTSTHLLLREPATGTWEARSYPDMSTQKVVFDGEDKGLIISDNKVYRTADAGRTWTTDGKQLPFSTNPVLIQPDGQALMLAHRYRVYGGDALAFIGFIVYESTDAGANWTVRKTEGTCGLYHSILTTESGRLVFASKDGLVLLD